MGKHFVLIHGAWHGGWVWDGLIEALKAAGHTAEAPTMPGNALGDDRSGVAFDQYVRKIADVVNANSDPVVLVGHSSAGFLLQAAAPKAAGKIERIVFANAFILADGACQFDLVPPEAAEGLTAAANASPDNSVPVVEEFVRGSLIAGNSTEEQDRLLGLLVPQPLTLFTTKVATAEFNALQTPKSVLFCKDDTSLPPGAYLGMAGNLGEYDLVEIDGGHETLYFQPADFMKGLLKAVGE